MRVLIIGNGGREHALAWKIAQSPLLSRLFIAPGNPGTAQHGETVPIGVEDIAGLVGFAASNMIDLVIPGPELPLALGIADALAAAGIACFGPGREAARLESSKRFTKQLCEEAGIPTASWASFTDAGAARAYLADHPAPIVIKADGLAGGKGVVVAATDAEAEAAVAAMLGQDGSLDVVIEECLVGAEMSLFALCDGEAALFCGTAMDHKRAHDGDMGPNTGGMGAIAPHPAATPALIEAVMEGMIRPTLACMAARGTPFRGFLFAGLMLTDSGPRLIEYNVRFGDPECEALMPLLADDLLAVLHDAAQGRIDPQVALTWRDAAAATVVMAAEGYPGAYRRGARIGLGDKIAEGTMVFHAGTADQDGALVSAGGRVLAVTATAADLQAAIEAVYRTVGAIDFPGGFHRRDIGART